MGLGSKKQEASEFFFSSIISGTLKKMRSSFGDSVFLGSEKKEKIIWGTLALIYFYFLGTLFFFRLKKKINN